MAPHSLSTGSHVPFRERAASSFGIVVLLLGFALWYGTNLAGSFHVDETLYAQSGLAVFRGNPYTNPTHAFAPTAKYFIGLGQVLFGQTAAAARVFVAGFGLASVYLTYRLTAALRGRAAGLVAALFLGTSYPFATQSVVAMLDVPLACFVVALTVVTLRWFRSRDPAWLPFVGLFLAATATTKAYGFLYGLPHALFVAGVLARRYGLRSLPRRSTPFLGGLVTTLAVVYLPLVLFSHPPAPAEYTSGVPFAATVLDLPVVGNFAYVFGAALLKNLVHTGDGHAVVVAGTVHQYPPVWSYLYWLFEEGGSLLFGSFVLAAAAALHGAFVRRDAEWTLPAGAILLPFVALSLLTVKFPRYVLPLYPLVFAVGVVAARDVLAAVRRSLRTQGVRLTRPRASVVVVLLVAVALLAPPSAALQSATDPIETDAGYDEAAEYVQTYAANHPDETVTVLVSSGTIRIPMMYYLSDVENVEVRNFQLNDGVTDERYAEARADVESGEIDVVVVRADQPRLDAAFREVVETNGELERSAPQIPGENRVEVYRVTSE
ncbi:ArnT family glycosyltransferase [Halogeometricum limi]|uniref:4-amino-4-deoxy-L-arabinose transferase n=1 Tax=Halogeometricum limi TaxID=555875 RepID=A0A1I6FTG2_9EURY|nr:glycosyltransferase family 39 protein [Halogeometricum limi]SFR33229.1 4-amino-4-deoxy-L-arabinose transferase [Halogeometricum limi]